MARLRVNELVSKNKNISDLMLGYGRIQGKIEQLVAPGTVEPEKGFIPEQDLAAQAAKLEQAFRKMERASDVKQVALFD